MSGQPDDTPSPPTADDVKTLNKANRRLEAQLRRSQRNLERLEEYRDRTEGYLRNVIQEMDEKAEQLRLSESEAQEASRAKSQFLANMSHEIRTPLNAVLGMTELLEQSPLNGEQYRFVNAIRESGEVLLSLINDVLDYSKAEVGKLELEDEDVGLWDLVESLATMFRESALHRGLEFAAYVDPALPNVVRGDVTRLRQVLLNLLSNAMKFTHEGGVVLRVVACDGGMRFEVEDTGIGIAKDAQQRLFDAFVQADGSTTRRYGGTGLGLAICRQLVELMGGELTIDSEPGGGSKFSAKVPLVSGVEVTDSAWADSSGRSVLLVSERPWTRSGTEATLRHLGLEVTTANVSGADAILRAGDFDVVLVDAGATVSQALRTVGKPTLRLMRAEEAGKSTSDHVILTPPQRAELKQTLAATWGGPAVREPRLSVKDRPPLVGRVLIVEDNPINQLLARRVIEKLGMEAVVAENGQRGFEVWQEGGFDAVLMDCHMPIMDGLQCTEAIRGFEQEHDHERTPIIALTANVSPGERAKCLAAGMDDYLSKPFKQQTLYEVLGRFLGTSEKDGMNQTQPKDVSSGDGLSLDPALFDPQKLDDLVELYGGTAPAVELLIQWVDQTAKAIENLAAAIADADSVAVSELAHAMKSSTKQIGAADLGEKLFTLEALGKAAALGSAEAILEQARELFVRCEAEVLSLGPAPADPEPDGSAVEPEETTERTILIADDEPTMRSLIRAALEPLGCRIVEAESGEEALELYHRHHPDLVILDVVMPGKTGFEVCQEIRQNCAEVETGIVMLTGANSVDAVQQAFDVGATDFLTKPFNSHIIRHRLQYLLRSRTVLESLAESQARLEAAQAIGGFGTWVRNAPDGRVWVSDEAREIMGLGEVEWVDCLASLRSKVHPEDRGCVDDAMARLKPGVPLEQDYRVVGSDGSIRWIRERAEVHSYSSRQGRQLQGTVMDVTERFAAQRRIETLAYTDSVTGLANRARLLDTLGVAVKQADETGTKCGIIFVDLDRFKRVNDTLGHSAGDELLRCVAKRLDAGLRGGEREAGTPAPTLGRFGGDEFVIVVPGLERRSELEVIAARLTAGLRAPFNVFGNELVSAASMGLSVYPDDGSDAESLLGRADAAMYDAKANGGGGFRSSLVGSADAELTNLQFEGELRHAIENEQLEVYYQPKLIAGSGEVAGAEALVRWHHPTMGLVSPGKFIPLAEETGLIVPLGRWVLEEACRQMRDWVDLGLECGSVAVNLSAVQFREPDLIDEIIEVLDLYGLDPHRLEVELTESAVLEDVPAAAAQMQSLRDIGIGVALDDFGTGQSSLWALEKLPLSTLKVDRCFVAALTEEASSSRAIASTVIHLGKSLGMTVVAEGVENTAQFAFLCQAGCDLLQGFLFGTPLPAEDFAVFLQASNAQYGTKPVAPGPDTSFAQTSAAT